MQGIKDWARRNPKKLQEFLNANPSYVFFRELPKDLAGPIGSLGVPLTAERSIAVDPRVIPLGVPVYLATTWPNTPQPLNRLMVAQDTGGAIAGGVRADFFWGFGDAAGARPARCARRGACGCCCPKGYAPPPAAEQQREAIAVTIAFWCILVAALLPYVERRAREVPSAGYDNRSPRDWEAQLEGWRQARGARARRITSRRSRRSPPA